MCLLRSVTHDTDTWMKPKKKKRIRKNNLSYGVYNNNIPLDVCIEIRGRKRKYLKGASSNRKRHRPRGFRGPHTRSALPTAGARIGTAMETWSPTAIFGSSCYFPFRCCCYCCCYNVIENHRTRTLRVRYDLRPRYILLDVAQ